MDFCRTYNRSATDQVHSVSLTLVSSTEKQEIMCKITLIAVLSLAALVAAQQQFDLPMVVDFGSRTPDTPRVNQQVQSFGPFTTPRNLTFRFEWETPEFNITGVRIRGSQPRYEQISIIPQRLQIQSYAIEVNVINTNYALFWAEAFGWEEIVPVSDNWRDST